MGSDLDLRGVYVPLITPFTADDKVALVEVERLANEMFDAGAAGIVALGTTGEPATLEHEERRAVIETVGSVCRARSRSFIVGAGTNSTKATIEAVREAALVPGLSAVLSVVPYYTRPSEAGIVAHYKALAETSPVPVIVYNIPYRTGRGLGAAALLELAHTANIAGLKQAVGGVDSDTLTLLAGKPDDFHVLSGDDAFIFSTLCLGGSGAIAASSHLCTDAFVQLVDAGLKGDVTTGRDLAEALLPLCSTLFSEPSPSVLKAVLQRTGRISTPALRSPMTEASAPAVEAAVSVLAEVQTKLAGRSAA